MIAYFIFWMNGILDCYTCEENLSLFYSNHLKQIFQTHVTYYKYFKHVKIYSVTY